MESPDPLRRKMPANIPFIATNIVLFVICAVAVFTSGHEKISEAKSLIGSTSYGISEIPQVITQTIPTGQEEKSNSEILEYKYIEPARLEELSVDDLGIWYLQQFPDESHINPTAMSEFKQWLDGIAAEDPEKQAAFDARIAFLADHPEIVNPPDPEEEEEEEEAIPPADTTPAPAEEQTSASSTQLPAVPATPTSSYSLIDDTYLNGCTAAEVANWVYNKFMPGSSWDYAALTEYYRWIDQKAESNPGFKITVNNYLDIMGWQE